MRKTDVKFVATYETGHQEWLWIDPATALAGDHVIGRIARHQQQEGKLPEGRILSVKRVHQD